MKARFIFSVVLIIYMSIAGYAQDKRTYQIGVLLDERTTEVNPLIERLKQEIKSVVGEDANLEFPEDHILTNNHDLEKAKENYQTLISGPSDIIMAFGIINNVVVSQQTSYAKPTVLFGATPIDFTSLDGSKTTSGIHNLVYLITSQSFSKDLADFEQIFQYKKIGIAVDKAAAENLPVKELLDNIFIDSTRQYKFIPCEGPIDIINNLNDIDALYLGGGFLFSDDEITTLSRALIDKGIPSFTSTSVQDVELGLMATNQTQSNFDQLIRRLALSVEGIINGTDPADLPLYLDNNRELTVNYNTAEKLGVPIRYSLIATTNFVGDFVNVIAEKKYNLLEVMQEVVNTNLSLKASAKDIELADQDIKTARSNYLPDITASATGTYLDPDLAEVSNGQNPELTTAGNITLTQTIYSPAVSANIDIQKDVKEATSENYHADKLDAIFNASNAYLNALLLKANLQISSSNLDVTKRNLQIARQNFEAGQADKSDVLRFTSQIAQNTQQLVEAVNQLEQAYYDLNQVLNYPIDREIDVAEATLGKGVFEEYSYEELKALLDNPTLVKPFIEYLIVEAKKNAPELKSLDYNLSATDRSLKLAANGRYIPTLALQGQYNRNFSRGGAGTEFPMGFPEVPESNYNVALNLSIPIFQQNQQNINRQTAIIQTEQIRINQDNLELSIERNVNTAVLQIINQISNLELSQVSERAAKESLELTQESYARGAVNRVQLIDAQNNYFQAQLANASAVYNFLISAIQLERNIGYFFLLHTKEENSDFRQRFASFISNRN